MKRSSDLPIYFLTFGKGRRWSLKNQLIQIKIIYKYIYTFRCIYIMKIAEKVKAKYFSLFIQIILLFVCVYLSMWICVCVCVCMCIIRGQSSISDVLSIKVLIYFEVHLQQTWSLLYQLNRPFSKFQCSVHIRRPWCWNCRHAKNPSSINMVEL